MKRAVSLTLLLTLCFSGLFPLCAVPARAQEVASVGSLGQLREQYERLLAIERDPKTTPEVREVNHTFLEERRAQLVSALRERIGALRKYQSGVASTLGVAETRAVEGSIQRLIDELQALQPSAAPPPSFAPATRPSRRNSRTPKAAPVIEAAYAAEAAPVAEPERTEPADEPGRTPEAPRKAAAIVITSPARDKVIRVAEVEIEVSVNDEDIDDLMVAVYTPASDKPKIARTYELKRSEKGLKSVPIALSRGENRIEVSDLKRGEVKAARIVTFQPTDTPALGATVRADAAQDPQGQGGAAAPKAPEDQKNALLVNVLNSESKEYDWGRIRGYFTGGVVFSKEREEFSKSDIVLSFVLDKNYIRSRRWNVNTFFEARLSAVPVTAVAGATASPTPTPTPTPAGTNEVDTFITSRKAALAQAGVYIPVNVTHWLHDRNLNSLFVAPMLKGGIQTITGDRQTAEATLFGKDDVYNFFSGGLRFGHYRYPRPVRPCGDSTYLRYIRARLANERTRGGSRALLNDDALRKRLDAILSDNSAGMTDDKRLENARDLLNSVTPSRKRAGWDDWDYDDQRECDEPWDYAPELISWLDITTGRWENFEVEVPTGFNDRDGNPIKVRRRPWRYQAEGRLKIPGTPFLVGFDGNFGDGPDDVRFGFGMRFDVGKLIQKLKAIQAFEALERQPVPGAGSGSGTGTGSGGGGNN